MDKHAEINTSYRVGFLLIDGFALLSYASAVEPLRAANVLAQKTIYDVRAVSVAGDHAVSSSGAIVPATPVADKPFDLDLVFVVAGGDPVAFRDAAVFRWLRQIAQRGVMLAGVSGGPVILASAGLMEGRRMTVHWEHRAMLAEISPALMIEHSLYVIDRDRMTCAGGIAALDMLYALLADHHGYAFARKVSDWFMHTEVRPSAGPQRAGVGERFNTTSAPLIRAIGAMEDHLADLLDLAQLARLAEVSPRQLSRLFRDKLGLSAMDFYRKLRLEKAQMLLKQSSLNVTQIALSTGFANSAHFAAAFREQFGSTPSSIRPRKK
ncbi:MAG: GlxA family transcriptional regulator [Gammaproteobacteria bacterium]|nr:GlxA family transcriptional regulator [Gammaproteobacteria bacterium]